MRKEPASEDCQRLTLAASGRKGKKPVARTTLCAQLRSNSSLLRRPPISTVIAMEASLRIRTEDTGICSPRRSHSATRPFNRDGRLRIDTGLTRRQTAAGCRSKKAGRSGRLSWVKGPAYHELPVDGQAGSRITNPAPIEPDQAQNVPLARVAILIEMDCKSVIRRLHNDMVDQFLLTFVDRRTLLS